MKVILKLAIHALALFIYHSAMAQLERNHISPSPNASAAVSAANINMNHYTGVANISVPLQNIAGKDVSIPISLDYQTSGIKVSDVSTSVGLGWSLNANAFAITRIVRGIPDGAKRNCNTDGTGKISRSEIWWTNFEDCDAERDIFYFNYPSRSGKMFLDNSGQPQTMPYQDILISPGVGSASIGYWKITDESGYTYYFGESTASREETTYSVGNYNTNSFTQKYTFIATWYLTRIVSPNGAQVATFNYNPGSNVTYYKTGARVFECKSAPDVIPHTRVDMKIQINSPKYISTISTDISSCVFDYDNNRQDLPGALRLASVSFKDHTETVKKKYHVEGGCFQVLLGFGSCTRLKLQSIKEGISNPVTTHTFLYNESILLPPETSFFTDHYGYFNRNSTDIQIDANTSVGYPEHSIARVDGVCNYGRYKTPNGNALAAILNEIQVAAGGRTVFAYDVQAGARVTSISNYNGPNLVSQSAFSYAGETYKSAVYHYYNIENANSLIRSSNAYNAISDLNGVSIGYGTVTETLLDGSKIVRTFYNFSDTPDDLPIVARYRGTTTVTFQAYSDVNSAPFTPYSSRAWMRGLPKTISINDATNNTLQKDEFFYQSDAPLSTVWNMAVEAYNTTPGDYKFYVGDYMLRSQHAYLSYKNNYIYDQTDFTKSKMETVVFYYHSTHKTFPASIDMNYGWHSKRITYKYPIDLTGTGTPPPSPDELAAGVWSLLTYHVIIPIEKLEYRQDEATLAYKLIGGELSTFRKNAVNNRPLLKEIHSLNRASAEAGFISAALTSGGTVLTFDNNYQLIQSFAYDDASAGNSVNLISTTDSNVITRNFEYGYNNTLVTADYSSLGSTQFRNQYSYNTINGLLSKSDANSQSTSYEYDNFGRLKLTKDNSGNIVSRYRYNIKTINEFNIGITSSNSAPTGQSITISSSENGESAGVTKYIWDFGDGQVSEGTSTVVYHSYSTAGTYTVKLAKVNPEYGKLLTTRQITIYAAPTVSITNSCTAIDLCSQTPYCNVTASGSGGCSALTYSWYYSYAGGTWINFGAGSQATFYPSSEGSYQIKCTVSDTCSNTAESIQNIQAYKSDPNCPQP